MKKKTVITTEQRETWVIRQGTSDEDTESHNPNYEEGSVPLLLEDNNLEHNNEEDAPADADRSRAVSGDR